MKDYSVRISSAIEHFWKTRLKQDQSQGSSSGFRDAGNRKAVTGGKQLDGFVELLAEILEISGLPNSVIYTKKTVLPGYFRPTKNWDLVAVYNDNLIASVEFKSHVGPSFGNNFNNRVEEALGSASDILAAYREGAFKPSTKPWLGWLMVLEDAEKSATPVKVQEPHYSVFDEFKGASYLKRYELFCLKLIRERLYDHACLLTSSRVNGLNGRYGEPNSELEFNRFAASLSAHARAFSEKI